MTPAASAAASPAVSARDAHTAPAHAVHKPRGLPGQASAEHEFEAEPGLPEALPSNERLLWRGSPSWRVMAREAMHTRTLSVYFAVLLLLRGITTLGGGGSWLDAAVAMLWLLPLALLALGALTLMGWLIARTSVYTVTDKRVVMRIGVVLNITFNLPFAQIESAALRSNADGSGDITLALAGTDRIAYVHLWPHARPWQLQRTQPMLRALPQVQQVAALLSAALADAAGAAGNGLPAVQLVPAQAVREAAANGKPHQPQHQQQPLAA